MHILHGYLYFLLIQLRNRAKCTKAKTYKPKKPDILSSRSFMICLSFLFEMMMKIMDWWHDILLLILHLQNITFIRCRLICSLYLHTICFGSMIREIGESTYGKCISTFNMKHVMRQSSDNAVSINNFYWIILCLVAIGVKTQFILKVKQIKICIAK